MANRYAIGSGLASNPAIWDGGTTVPVDGDRVLIQSGFSVELDGAYTWGDDSTATVVINGVSTTNSITVQGTLKHSRTTNNSLTCRGTIQFDAGGTHDKGSYADPIQAGVSATLLGNLSATMVANKYRIIYKGGCTLLDCSARTRKRVALLTTGVAPSDTTIYVNDATGWQVGDEIHLPNTFSRYYGSSYQQETVTIASGYVSGDLAVPITSGALNTHDSGTAVANITSEVKTGNYNNTYPTVFYIEVNTSSVANTHELSNVMYDTFGSAYPYYGFNIAGQANYGATPWANPFKYIESVAFVSRLSTYMSANINNPYGIPATFNDCVFINTLTGSINPITLNETSNYTYNRCLHQGCALYSQVGATFNNGWAYQNLSAPYSGASRSYRFNGQNYNEWCKPAQASANPSHFDMIFDSCDFSYVGNDFQKLCSVQSANCSMAITLKDCHVGTRTTMESKASQTLFTSQSYFKVINRNSDVTLQEEYTQYGQQVRNNSVTKRSTSSAELQVSAVDVPYSRSFEIPVAIGEVVNIVGYCQYDTNYYNGGTGFVAPTVTLSGTINGVTLTPATYTASSGIAGTWEKFDISITNSSGSAGAVTVTYDIQTSNINGIVYIDGVNDSPFVTTTRHYGYIFDEANPKRTVNPSVSASEAVAGAYTGMALTFGATTTSSVISLDNTFQKFYDYGQAESCLNLTSVPPTSGVGTAGNVSLTANGNITINTTKVLNGAGNIYMGAYTLTSELSGAIPYTYTGGTWSQLTTVPTFAGGQLNLGASGTYTFTVSADTILSMTPTAPSTYNMGSGVFSGQLDLRNTTANAITVQLPSGTSYTTANNTGGTITVTTPAIYQQVTISGAVAGSRIQLYDTATATELYNGTPTFPYVWTDPTPASSSRDIRLRVSYTSGTTSYDHIEANIGTCGTASYDYAISYVVAQTLDSTYNTNAIDGSLVTGVTIQASPARVLIDLAGGTITWAQIYAYQEYFLFTATGIAQTSEFISAPDTANYLFTGYQLKNINANPLTITGGYGRDATTGTVLAMIDTTGTAIFPAPDHVVAYATGSALTAGQDATLTEINGKIGTPTDTVSADLAKKLSTGQFIALK
jgi:hypothetical protein